MKFTIATVMAAVSAFAPLVSSHVVMNMPLPFNGDQDNAPLAADGSNYPCKLTGTASGSAAQTTYVPGTAGSFTLKGSAVHGGGSCQISITYDNPPTKNSVFKVVQSYEGSCPVNTAGNLPANPNNMLPSIPVTLPVGLKAGEAVFAWTWFNRIGNREMYMNCAPITIGGSGSSDSVFNSLPDMFVANIAVPQSQCTTKETFDILFPNPGQNVVKAQGDTNFTPACGGSDGSSGGSSGAASSAAAAPIPSSAVNTPNVSTQPALVGASSMSQPSVGTVFTPINGPVSTPAVPVMTTLMTVTQSVVTTVPQAAPTMAASSTAAAPAAPAPTGGSSSSSSSSSNTSEPVMMGACNPSMGQILCESSDLSIYYECYGEGTDGVKWGPFPVPENTVCSAARGTFVNKLTARHARRFARNHMRAHQHRSI